MVTDQGIASCIPPGRNGNKRVAYSKRVCNMGHKVENLLARFKDWRRIATRYDRCAHIFLSAVLLGAAVIFWYEAGMRPDPGTRINQQPNAVLQNRACIPG